MKLKTAKVFGRDYSHRTDSFAKQEKCQRKKSDRCQRDFSGSIYIYVGPTCKCVALRYSAYRHSYSVFILCCDELIIIYQRSDVIVSHFEDAFGYQVVEKNGLALSRMA